MNVKPGVDSKNGVLQTQTGGPADSATSALNSGN